MVCGCVAFHVTQLVDITRGVAEVLMIRTRTPIQAHWRTYHYHIDIIIALKFSPVAHKVRNAICFLAVSKLDNSGFR